MSTHQKKNSADIHQPISLLDRDLLNRCIDKESRAQEKLYKRWSGKLLVIPLRYTSSRQESIEILNASFLKIFQSLQNYSETSNGTFSGWMAKIVLNTTIDDVRKSTKYKKKFDFNIEVESPIESGALNNLAVEEILKLIKLLPSHSKTIFNLYVIEGYKHTEIAKMLNISSATSRWHLSEARKTMKTLITKYYNQ